MNRTEVKALLALAALYDRRPVSDADVAAWLPLMQHMESEDAQAAVLEHYAESRYPMTPHDVSHGVRKIRNRRIDESGYMYNAPDPNEPPEVYVRRYRAQLAAVADGEEIPPQAQALKQRPVAELISGIASKTRIPEEVQQVLERRRHPAMASVCPACRATAGEVCQSGTGRPLTSRMHPSRVETWAVGFTACPECASPRRMGCLELGHPYKHGVHSARVAAAQKNLTEETT